MSTTWNPSDKGASVTLTGSNLIASVSGTASGTVRSIDRVASGKTYFEVTFTTVSNITAGIATAAASLTTGATQTYTATVANNTGSVAVNGASLATLGAITAGSVVCFAFDLDAQLFWARNGAAGNWNASATANPATGAGGLALAPGGFGHGISAYGYCGFNSSASGSMTANFGGSAFTGTVPSGFTSGIASPSTPALSAVATQLALEQWAGGTTNQMQATQLALEQWASTSFVTPPTSVPAMVLVMA